MTQLKNFNMIQASLNKLQTNIEVRGVQDALMKRGEPIEYEEKKETSIISHEERRKYLRGQNSLFDNEAQEVTKKS